MELVFQKLKVPENKVSNFTLSALELHDFIDFEVKRVYFLTSIIGSTSAHCHKLEKELFVMLKGACTVVIDRGQGLEEIALNSPQDAIYVGNYVWHNFKDFSEDTVLLALSSTNYSPDRSDYIENYDEYRKVIEA